MSSIALSGNAAGAGVFTIASPNSASSFTATLPAATTTLVGTDATQTLTNKTLGSGTVLPAGSVRQVLQSFKTDTYSQTSQTYTVITGLTVSITPTSATSKILVMAQIGCNSAVGADSWAFAVGRGGSVVTASTGDAAGSRPRATAVMQQTDAAIGGSNSQFTLPIMFLDSPATTSSTTYSIMGRTANGGTLYVNRTGADRDTANYDPRWTSSITVMEILV
jgi:hypothetical protein